MIQKLVIVIGIVLLTLGCRVDSNVVSLSTKDVTKAIDGKVVSVRFKAVITVPMDLEDKSQKTQLDAIQQILENYVDIEDYDIGKGVVGTKIEMEGTIPLLRSDRNDDVKVSVNSAWALVVIPIDKTDKSIFTKYDYRLSLATTNQFPNMNDKLRKVNFMLTAKKTQPMKIRLKNKDGKKLELFCGPVEYKGKSLQYFEESFDSKKITLGMKGGIYEKVQPNLFFSIQK